MTYQSDILGRPPARKVFPAESSEHESCDDWRGENFIRAPKKAIPVEKPDHHFATIEAQERRARVAEMFRQGYTVREMMKSTGCAERTIRHDISVLGLKLRAR